jgi:hypothetical protein
LWLPSRVVASAVGHVPNPRRQIVANPPLTCPDDGHPLIVRRAHGVELDFCGNCGGVWLDHGELERILARKKRPSAARAIRDGSMEVFPDAIIEGVLQFVAEALLSGW